MLKFMSVELHIIQGNKLQCNLHNGVISCAFKAFNKDQYAIMPKVYSSRMKIGV